MQKKFGYDNIEDIEHYHNNKYFDPNYKSIYKDSCDFLMIGVWVDFKKRAVGLEDIPAAAQISFVWNDAKGYGRIIDVTIYFSKSSAYFMKPLCTVDLEGKEILNWKWKGRLPLPNIQNENIYVDIYRSHHA